MESLDTSILSDFPLEVFSYTCREFAKNAATLSGSNVDMTSLIMLAALSEAIGNTRCLRLRGGWKVTPTIWGAIVAPPSSGKSPALRAVLWPLREKDYEAQRDYRTARKAYEETKKALETRGAPRPGIQHVGMPEEPENVRYIMDDFTMEAAAERLQSNPRGLMVDPDELSSVIFGLNQYKGGHGNDRQKLVKIWNNDPVTVDRKSSPEPVSIKHPILNIIGGIQSDRIFDLVGKQGNDGLLARFLYVNVRGKPNTWDQAIQVKRQPFNDWNRLIFGLLKLTPKIDVGGLVPYELTMTPEAEALWAGYYELNEQATFNSDLPGLLTEYHGKLEEQAARMALILELADNPTATTVSVESIANGWKLAFYFLEQAKRVFNLAARKVEDQDVEKLKVWLEQRGGKATKREIQRAKVAGLRTSSDIMTLVDRFIDSGYGMFLTEGKVKYLKLDVKE